MFIKKISVKNFRKFDDKGIEFNFKGGINIIIGENNIGKSSIMDILRLVLTSGKYKKGFYISTSDFHINELGMRANEIQVDVYFEGLNPEQGVAFYEMTDGSDVTKAELHVRYTITSDSKGKERVRDYIYGGTRENPISREVFDNITLTYMAALRDVENELKPSRNSQIANLLYSYASKEEDKKNILDIFNQANESVRNQAVINNIENKINNNLNLIEKEELNQEISIGLVPATFEGIAGTLDAYYKKRYIYIEKDKYEEIIKEFEGINIEKGIVFDYESNYKKINMSKLRIKSELKELYEKLLEVKVQDCYELKQNGLGYNNLLSMAATLGNLQEKPSDEELAILLVEEPEAHLHPQLLDLLFNFFKQSNESNNIQIFMTSHSPALISKADIDSLNVIYSDFEDRVNTTSLKDLDMTIEEKEDLKRYLDVTKSQLFFAKRVLFVEGISEAILFSEFAKLLGKPFDKYSIEVVNINGVAFGPFAKLFEDNEKRNNLKYKCAIVSDNDRCTNKDDDNYITKDDLKFTKRNVKVIKDKLSKGEISKRADELQSHNGDNVKVFLAEKTFEYELALIKENNDLLIEVLKTIHPQNGGKIEKELSKEAKDRIMQQDEIAIWIWLAIRDCKGVFAQRLAAKISQINSAKEGKLKFKVPDYIKNAIDYLVGEV